MCIRKAAIKLRALIKASGLTKSAYARHVMRCDPRTLRRWLSGERPMQPRTLAWIDAQDRLASPHPRET